MQLDARCRKSPIKHIPLYIINAFIGNCFQLGGSLYLSVAGAGEGLEHHLEHGDGSDVFNEGSEGSEDHEGCDRSDQRWLGFRAISGSEDDVRSS